jgi:hypothetical protein
MQAKYLDICMPPLIAKWQQLSNSDKDLFPLLECFTSIAQVLIFWSAQTMYVVLNMPCLRVHSIHVLLSFF